MKAVDELARDIEEMRMMAREAVKVMEVVEELLREERSWKRHTRELKLSIVTLAATFALLTPILYATAGLDGLLASLFALTVGAAKVVAGVLERAR